MPFSEYYKHKNGKFGLRPRCKACIREYYEANKDRRREYREANREELADYQREYYRANRQKLSAWYREHYQANKDRRREYREAHKAEIAARMRKWQKANPNVTREHNHRRRAKIREATVVPFSQEELLKRMAYFGNKCWMCGGPFEHIDHVKPISKGGPHMLSNLRPSCRSCNSSKGAKWPLEELNFK